MNKKKSKDDLVRASYCQPVLGMSIMAAISVMFKLSLDNVNDSSRYCRSSNSRALMFEST